MAKGDIYIDPKVFGAIGKALIWPILLPFKVLAFLWDDFGVLIFIPIFVFLPLLATDWPELKPQILEFVAEASAFAGEVIEIIQNNL